MQAHGSESGIEQYLRRISLTRLEQGFDIREVIQALLLLHRAVLLVANQHQNGEPIQVLKVCLDLDDSLRLMVSQFGSLYSSAMNRSLEEQQQQAAILSTRKCVSVSGDPAKAGRKYELAEGYVGTAAGQNLRGSIECGMQ